MRRLLFSLGNWKMLLALLAIFIVIGTLFYTNYLVEQISKEERAKVELWARAIQNRAELVKQSNAIFRAFEIEDKKNISIWAEANRFMVQYEGDGDIYFPSKILTNNTTIPVIIADGKGTILFTNNFSPQQEKDSLFLSEELERLREKNPPINVSYKIGKTTFEQWLYYDESRIFSALKNTIENIARSFINETVINLASVPVLFMLDDSLLAWGNIPGLKSGEIPPSEMVARMKSTNNLEVELEEGRIYTLFYEDSVILVQLRLFPFVLLSIVAAFLIISFVLFSIARRNEQNLLWVGMSKETAHQLGTPISSLLGWVELMELQHGSSEAILEIRRDVERLQGIAERFSKIGSLPDLQPEPLSAVVKSTLDYLRPRIRHSILFEFQNHLSSEEDLLPLNKPLFSWALENIIRNGVDAIQGPGKITLVLSSQGKRLVLDITDTGKGIPRRMRKKIFQAGFTTKKRGWGLGLSLARRIVREYHKGRIFVKWSEPEKGTTFRLFFSLPPVS